MRVQPSNAILIPDEAKRVLVFSNCKGKVPAGLVRAGDVCVHLNTARHFGEVRDIPGTWHELIVRHGRQKDGPNPVWFMPKGSLEGFDHIHFTPTIFGWSTHGWWHEYSSECRGKNPTTGFLAYRVATMEADTDGTPVILVGFDPAHDAGSFRSSLHGWDYEARVYEREKATIVPLDKE